MSDFTQARKALVARILEGDGRVSHAQRRAAFDNAGLAEPLTMLKTSPQRGHRGSAKTKSSRSWYVPPSARPRGSTTRRSRPSGPRLKGVTMRLAILDSGHGFGAKILFAFIRAVSRQPVPDVVKLNHYRPDFYGTPMREVAQEAMRGPSAWSVGDRELMAAFVSKMNECEF
jgi:hypothetical protein